MSAESFLDRLRKALGKNGDFPTSAKTVAELIELTKKPGISADVVSEVILREPSLSLRLLSLVNSSFYLRGMPVTSLTQAIVQVGMSAIAQLCAGLVLIQKLLPEARKNSVFSLCFRKSVVTSLLMGSLTVLKGKDDSTKSKETGYLIGFMSEIGILLMTYYFPQVYENVLKRSATKKQSLDLSLQGILGLSPTQLSIEVVTTLGLPKSYREMLRAADDKLLDKAVISQSTETQTGILVATALAVSSILCTEHAPEKALEELMRVCEQHKLDWADVEKILKGLPQEISDYCQSIEITLPTLPVDISAVLELKNGASSSQTTASGTKTAVPKPAIMLEKNQDLFDQYLGDLDEAIANGELVISIITAVMETCAYCLSFDRVLLLLASKDKKHLTGRMILGNANGVDPTQCVRSIGEEIDPYAPDNQAFLTGEPIFRGTPLFDDGWPFAAIPIGSGKKCVGIIYADRAKKTSAELTLGEQGGILKLSSRLATYVKQNSGGV